MVRVILRLAQVVRFLVIRRGGGTVLGLASVVLMMVGGGYGTSLVCRDYWLVNTHQLSDFFLGVFGSCHSKASMQSIQRALNLI